MKSILIIIPDIPYPLTKGGRQGVFHFIDKLRKDFKISIIIKVEDEDKISFDQLKTIWNDVNIYSYFVSDYIQDKQSLISKIYNFPYYCKHQLSRKLKKEKRVNTDFVRAHSTLYVSKPDIEIEFIDFVSKITQANHFDFIQVEFYPLISLVHILPSDSIKIFVHHELRYVRNEIEMTYFKGINSFDRYTYNSALLFEIETLKLYDKVVTVSEIDKVKLEKLLPNTTICDSPLIVGLNSISLQRKFEFNNTLTFVASKGHFPNYDGLKWFLMDIWEELSRELPSLKLRIIGTGWEPTDFRDVKYMNNIIFEGYVKDLADVIPNSIAITPIRIGSGMRMKILDAIHYNAPFVTTSVGVEGLDFLNGIDCFIADTPDGYRNAIRKLVASPKLQEQFTINALNKLNKQYSEEKLVEKRKNIYNI